MLMKISVRDLHNDTIKPSDNDRLASVVNSVPQKVLIVNTTFRSFIPPPVHKMTPKSRQIGRYELCINSKDTQIDLNIYQKILVNYIQ